MDQPSVPDSTAWPFPFPRQDWEQTPPAVQAYLLAVQAIVTWFPQTFLWLPKMVFG